MFFTRPPVFTAAQFDSSSVRITAVGTLTFNGLSDGTANAQYSVNSSTVTKSLIRQSWRAVTGTATYTGGVNVTTSSSSCGEAQPYSLNSRGIFTLSIGTGTLDLGLAIWGRTCRYTGTYTQAGRVGASVGTSTCSIAFPPPPQSPATPAPFAMNLSDVRVTANAFSAHLSGNNGGCPYTGDIGGVRQQ